MIVLFGSYCEIIKDLIFTSRLDERKKLIKELDSIEEEDYQVNFRILRAKYSKVLREMFSDVSKAV